MVMGTALFAGAAGIIGDAVVRERDGAGGRCAGSRAGPCANTPHHLVDGET